MAVTGGPVTVGASATLRVNTTGAAVNRSFSFAGQTFTVALPAGTDGMFFELAVTDANLNIGGFVQIEGSVSFSSDRVAFTDVRIFLGQGPSQIDGQPQPGRPWGPRQRSGRSVPTLR